MLNFGERMYQAEIGDCKTIDEMINYCREYIKNHPERVRNGFHTQGWNQDLFIDSDRIPTRFDLDKISTEIPVILERICGHILTTNTKVIEMLGLDENSPQYNGGTFEIGEDNYPNECVDIYTAIDAYTIGSAYMEFMEEKKGRIKPGFLADLVILDKDIFTCNSMEIRNILPLMIMVDGNIIYRKEF